MEKSRLGMSVHKVEVNDGKFVLSLGYTNQSDVEQDITDSMVENISKINIPDEDLVNVIRSLVRTGVSYQKRTGKNIGFILTEEKGEDGQIKTQVQF